MTKAFDFDNWGSWGVIDLYDDTRAALEKALKSGRKFDSGWHGFKKEIASMRVSRDENRVIVECSAEMDDYQDGALIDDCLTSEEMERMTDDMYERILDALDSESMFSTNAYNRSDCYEKNPTVEGIVETAGMMLDNCERELNESFKFCIRTTLSVLYEGESEEKLAEITEARIKELVGEEETEELP